MVIGTGSSGGQFQTGKDLTGDRSIPPGHENLTKPHMPSQSQQQQQQQQQQAQQAISGIRYGQGVGTPPSA